jgi:hypothetical protein
MATQKLVLGLALVDLPPQGVKAGQVLQATPATIDALVKTGELDSAKAAVAYATEQGMPVVRSAVESAADQLAAEQDALRVDIAGLKDLLAKAEDEPTKAALETQLLAKANALAALG